MEITIQIKGQAVLIDAGVFQEKVKEYTKLNTLTAELQHLG